MISNKALATGGFLFFLFFLSAIYIVLFWGPSQQESFYKAAEQNSATYARNSFAPMSASCLEKPPAIQFECQSKAASEYRQYRREEQDLAAQKTSAFWAYLMGSAAVFGAVLSTLGVWLVGYTFYETRKTANAAIDAVKVARDAIGVERAWVTFASVIPEIHKDARSEDFTIHSNAIAFRMLWENSGRSPAVDVFIESEGRIIGINDQVQKFVSFPNTGPREKTTLAAGKSVGCGAFPIYGENYDLFMQGKTQILLWAKVTYRDVYKPENNRVSECCISATYRGGTFEGGGRQNLAFNFMVVGPQNSCN